VRGRDLPLALALAILTLSACAPGPISVRPPSVPPTARDYAGVYERWTRVGRVLSFKDMDTSLLVAATLRGPEFQQAYAARYVAIYRLEGTPDKDRFLADQRSITDAGVAFIVRTAGHNWKWADLASQKSYWRMALVDQAGGEVAPIRIEPVPVSREPIEGELLGGPLTGPLARFYHVTFPAQREGGQPLLRPGHHLTLRLSGPQGRTDLSWTLTE
jgi:hypothetical protein